MTTPPGAVVGAAALLERSITYMLGNLTLVGPGSLALPTPCVDWDLRTLLLHVEDGLAALAEAVNAGRVNLPEPVELNAVRRPPSSIEQNQTDVVRAAAYPLAAPAEADFASDPIDAVRAAARQVIEGWSSPVIAGSVRIDGMALSSALVAAAGGIEIAVHGWDIARAAGWRRPVPPSLAEEMLDLLPLLLTDASRESVYAAPVSVPAQSCPGDRLIAYLGRQPPGPVERRFLQSRAALLLTAR